MQTFFQGGGGGGGQIWGTDKRGGAKAYVVCYTLGGGENYTRGGKYPAPPLNTALQGLVGYIK